jgi:uncharacterized membrane protein
MDDKLIFLGVIFILASLIGFYLAYLYGRKTKRFQWNEYLALLVVPTLFVIALAYYVDTRILSLFLVSAAVGFLLEYIIGLAYHKTLNRRLWTYQRLSVCGYTSLLSIPIWGVAGVIFWFLSKMVGL